MTAPTTRLSYGDAYEALDLAKDDAKGIRLKQKDYASAATFRSRIHYARQVDRKDNLDIYDPGDPLFGRSVYDTLVVRIKQDTENRWWIYIEHATIANMVVESLSEIEEDEELEITVPPPKPIVVDKPEYAQSLTTDEPIKRRF